MSGAGTAAYLLLSACIVPEYRMSFQSKRARMRAVFVARALVAGTMLLPVGGLAAPADDLIAVSVDQAKLVKFP